MRGREKAGRIGRQSLSVFRRGLAMERCGRADKWVCRYEIWGAKLQRLDGGNALRSESEEDNCMCRSKKDLC